MIWGDEFRYTRAGRLLARFMPAILLILCLLFGYWFGWIGIVHPLRVERELARIREAAERTAATAWVIDGRLINIEDMAAEIRMWRAENRSIATTVLRRQGVRLPKAGAVVDTIRLYERTPYYEWLLRQREAEKVNPDTLLPFPEKMP